MQGVFLHLTRDFPLAFITNSNPSLGISRPNEQPDRKLIGRAIGAVSIIAILFFLAIHMEPFAQRTTEPTQFIQPSQQIRYYSPLEPLLECNSTKSSASLKQPIPPPNYMNQGAYYRIFNQTGVIDVLLQYRADLSLAVEQVNLHLYTDFGCAFKAFTHFQSVNQKQKNALLQKVLRASDLMNDLTTCNLKLSNAFIVVERMLDDIYRNAEAAQMDLKPTEYEIFLCNAGYLVDWYIFRIDYCERHWFPYQRAKENINILKDGRLMIQVDSDSAARSLQETTEIHNHLKFLRDALSLDDN